MIEGRPTHRKGDRVGKFGLPEGSEEKKAMATEHLTEIKKWAQELSRKKDESEEVCLNRALILISKNFRVQSHEVAILSVTSDERFLRFLAPDNLREVGQVPLSSGSALVARTVRERRPEIINHFSAMPHASVFEAVPIAEQQRGEPIQKIMSSPILQGDKVIGVLQVCRKGRSAAEAGADFTYPELRELKLIADTLAACVSLCRNS
jgi:GAF domain-containing protein